MAADHRRKAQAIGHDQVMEDIAAGQALGEPRPGAPRRVGELGMDALAGRIEIAHHVIGGSAQAIFGHQLLHGERPGLQPLRLGHGDEVGRHGAVLDGQAGCDGKTKGVDAHRGNSGRKITSVGASAGATGGCIIPAANRCPPAPS